MTPDSPRSAAEAIAIEDGPTRLGKLKFRTFTSLSFERCMRCNIRLAIAGQETVNAMTAFEIMREAAFVGWMQTSPRETVRETFAEGDEAIWDAVEEWEENFNAMERPPWGELIRKVSTIILAGKALAIDLIETATAKKLKGEGETPPPNSLAQAG
jgi:hypothetical protein